MNKKSIPGWTLVTEEISNGIFKATLTDICGRKAEMIDNTIDETIEKTVSSAFDIEKRISQNWSLFLFELAIQNVSEKDDIVKDYSHNSFGSWFIESREKRLIFDGRDSLLLIEVRDRAEWKDTETITNDELNYTNFVRLVNQLTENTSHNGTLPKAIRSMWNKLFGP